MLILRSLWLFIQDQVLGMKWLNVLIGDLLSLLGVDTASRLAGELSRRGALIVSGMAEGIDCCAVRGALKGGGPVVSVVAGGVDVKFPYENRYLYDDVAAAGALISEYPPGTPHKGDHFNPRNRILSGLSLGVLAVECAVTPDSLVMTAPVPVRL